MTNFGAVSDPVLVGAAVDGDKDAFTEIVNRYGPQLHRYARGALSDSGAADEVVQDAFVAAWRGLDHFRAESSLRTWLFSIVSNKITDSRRRRSAAPVEDWLLERPSSDAGSDPYTVASGRDFMAELTTALAELALPAAGLLVAEGGRGTDLSRDRPDHAPDRERRPRIRNACPRDIGGKVGDMAMTPPPGFEPAPRGSDGTSATDDTVVERAARELRSQPTDPQWIDISSSIVSSIRIAARRSWPIDAAYPAGAAARATDTLQISDQVVKTAAHRALAGTNGAYTTKVDLDVDDHRCNGAHLTVTGIYGDVLPVTGDELARLTAATLTDLLGLPVDAEAVTVQFDDISPDAGDLPVGM